MPKMSRARPVQRPIGTATAALAILLACVAPAPAAECPHNGALGTSRIHSVHPAQYPQVGLKSFPQTLPLGDHEGQKASAPVGTVAYPDPCRLSTWMPDPQL